MMARNNYLPAFYSNYSLFKKHGVILTASKTKTYARTECLTISFTERFFKP
jgi:hypothetical protein